MTIKVVGVRLVDHDNSVSLNPFVMPPILVIIVLIQRAVLIDCVPTAPSSNETTLPSRMTSMNSTSKLYANHRMDRSDEPANSNQLSSHPSNSESNSAAATNAIFVHQDDRFASDSILRPQLAVQIYTSPSLQPSSQNNRAQGLQQPQQQQHYLSNGKFHQALPKSQTTSMLILPVSSALSQPSRLHNRLHNGNHNSDNGDNSLQSDFQQQQQRNRWQRAGDQSIDGLQGEMPQLSKLSPWHYISDQNSPVNSASPALDSLVASAGSEGSLLGRDGGDNGGGGGSPMINAIITVPSSGQLRQQQQHLIGANRLEEGGGGGGQNSSSGSVEYAISRLLDSQATGNIEFSMNLNGDEIIINPVAKQKPPPDADRRKKGGLDTESTGGDALSELDEGTGANSKSHRQIRASSGRADKQASRQNAPNKSLKKHLNSELAGDQQSASDQIDQIEEDNEDSFENDSIDSSSDDLSSFSPTKSDEEASISDSRSKDGNSELEKDENKNSYQRFWSSFDQNVNDEVGKQNDDKIQASKQSSIGKKLLASVGNKKNPTSGKQQASSSVKQVKSSHNKTKKSPNSRRKTSSSKRRSTYKSDERDSSNQEDDEKGQDVSSVTIKGEDVKKFEQLLESLRSLSLNNLNSSPKSRQQAPTPARTPKAKVDSPPEYGGDAREEDTPERETDEEASSPANNAKSWKVSGQQRSHSLMVNRLSGGETRPANNDCESKKRQQSTSLHKSASQDEPSSFDSESSSTTNDQNLSRKNSFDSEDFGSEDNSGLSLEPDEQGSINHNKVSALPTNLDSDNRLVEQRVDDGLKDQPMSLFVRKTILQSYYDNDNNLKPALNQSDDGFEAAHQSRHIAEHERQSGLEEGSQMLPINGGSSMMNSNNQHYESQLDRQPGPVVDDLSPLNNYISYNRLNERGSESRSSKVFVPS